MWMLILLTFLTSILGFIVVVGFYLFSVITEGSDEGSGQDSLALDSQYFNGSPNGSSNELPACTNLMHHHHDHQLEDELASEITEPGPAFSSGGLEESLSSSEQFRTLARLDSSKDDSSSVSSSTMNPVSKQTDADKPLPASVQKKAATSTSNKPPATDEFDTKEMQLEGNVIHWCKNRKTLDKYIKLGHNINHLNKRHETPLHVAIRRRSLPVAIGLVCHGADLEQRNERGETPLIMACRLSDILASQLLITFDSDVDATDNKGLSARHHVAANCERHKHNQQAPSASHLILAMLHEVGAKRCPPTHSCHKSQTLSCHRGCIHSGSYNGNSYNRWLDSRQESLYKRHMFSDMINNRINRRSGRDATNVSRILSIDGGGMRGVVICQIMIELEKYLKRPIIDYFDWVGGTSVGGFLASALCCGSSLRDMRRICFDVKDEVFFGTKPYNSKYLERVLKRVLGPKTRLSDVQGRKLAVATVLGDRDPCQLKIFRNYRSAEELLEQYGFSGRFYDSLTCQSIPKPQSPTATAPDAKVAQQQTPTTDTQASGRMSSLNDKPMSNSNSGPALSKSIKSSESMPKEEKSAKKVNSSELTMTEHDTDPYLWQVVRSSSAAPFFFRPYGPFLDGGIIANNPALDTMSEFFSYNSAKKFLRQHSKNPDRFLCELEPPLDLVLSLGTGRGRVMSNQNIIDFSGVASGLSTVFSPVELLRSIRAARVLFKKLVHRSCMTDDHVLDRGQAWCHAVGVPYFRLNPPLATIFAIDDKRDEQLINAMWQTKVYMRTMAPQLREIARLLDG